ncbi:hypothetical protein [Szabonella alba]|uniref:hypothetical protein n=1 Tax=Szabonella alba TaxID=2804194 RepID=UPI001F3D8DD4|nr:hypothetical protein [Szabonella alba]
MRAFLVMVLVAMPSVILPGTGMDGRQMVALVALFLAVLTFVEYNATYPGLVEFRDAPPYNRVRFMMLMATVFVLSMMQPGPGEPSTVGLLFEALGILMGRALDFPYSPVRLARLVLADPARPELADAVRNAAAAAFMISLAALAIFVVLLRLYRWPTQSGAFNVWVNLPTFDPTAGGDVVARLERDARINLVLGFLLPFLIPTVLKFGGAGLRALDLSSQQSLVWVMTAWAFLPASLCMRGIAMARIAGMIREMRARGQEVPAEGYLPA